MLQLLSLNHLGSRRAGRAALELPSRALSRHDGLRRQSSPHGRWAAIVFLGRAALVRPIAQGTVLHGRAELVRPIAVGPMWPQGPTTSGESHSFDPSPRRLIRSTAAQRAPGSSCSPHLSEVKVWPWPEHQGVDAVATAQQHTARLHCLSFLLKGRDGWVRPEIHSTEVIYRDPGRRKGHFNCTQLKCLRPDQIQRKRAICR